MPSSVEPSQPLPVYSIGHAGVGLLFDDRPVLQSARANLREIGEEILSLSPRPKAIVAFSGHFEAGEIHGPGVIEGEYRRQTKGNST
jgi:aromatic ring-opening dioxygenase catalytic subunit (LigB family)